MTKCPTCGTEVWPNMKKCFNCGTEMPKEVNETEEKVDNGTGDVNQTVKDVAGDAKTDESVKIEVKNEDATDSEATQDLGKPMQDEGETTQNPESETDQTTEQKFDNQQE